MAALAAPLREHPHVAEVRQTGMILAIEMVANKHTRAPFPASDRRGLRAYRHALGEGVLLRPLGDILYWMPPYCIDEEALQHLARATISALNEATR
jgi:adenosylmethionine-8-amino-7-oxononanoate aminotransferase